MLWDIIRFNKNARSDLETISPEITLEQYLSSKSYSKVFINNYVIPMGSAIWSTKADSMLRVPALFFIRFFNNHGLLQIKNRSGWWVIKGGSKEYIKKMIVDFKSKIRLNTGIDSITRDQDKIIIKTETGIEEEFDAVVIGTHSDQALKMLKDPSPKEQEILKALPYQSNDAILHTDLTVLPKRKSAWASWNYNLDQESDNPVTMTYNMNILQSLNASETYCVTLNSNELIEQGKILKKLQYHHPLFTIGGIDAQKRKGEISGVNNTYYCGAYWHNGFHEDGVVSALEVCSHFGLSL